jgi:2-aminoadipate transaminase
MIETAARMRHVRRSFVRDILKVAARPEVISFAGGLPNPRFIPVAAIAESMQVVLQRDGADALQYTASEGYPPLRQWIADSYAACGLAVSADQILITTGSQQALDLIGKILINPGDRVIVEQPTYLAALQAFGMYEPQFIGVPVDDEGIDIARLNLAVENTRLIYCMPNFQNPSGISYSETRRAELTKILNQTSTVLIEDDPYGQLRFRGKSLPPLACANPQRSVLLGTFSKTISPGMRIGWLCAPPELMEKLIIAKQAVDLHTENLGQRVIHHFLTHNDFEQHLQAIRVAYGRQCDAMLAAIKNYFSPQVRCTHPDGGMFLWVTLPEKLSAIDLFHRAIEKNVAFVPGAAFHVSGGENTMRLNFSNSDETRIDEGIRRIAAAMEEI